MKSTQSLRKSAQIINRLHNEYEATEESQRERAERIGTELIKVKKEVGHGNFLNWLEENCPELSERTARQYMAFARGDVEDLTSGAAHPTKSERRSDLPDDDYESDTGTQARQYGQGQDGWVRLAEVYIGNLKMKTRAIAGLFEDRRFKPDKTVLRDMEQNVGELIAELEELRGMIEARGRKR